MTLTGIEFETYEREEYLSISREHVTYIREVSNKVMFVNKASRRVEYSHVFV